MKLFDQYFNLLLFYIELFWILNNMNIEERKS